MKFYHYKKGSKNELTKRDNYNRIGYMGFMFLIYFFTSIQLSNAQENLGPLSFSYSTTNVSGIAYSDYAIEIRVTNVSSNESIDLTMMEDIVTGTRSTTLGVNITPSHCLIANGQTVLFTITGNFSYPLGEKDLFISYNIKGSDNYNLSYDKKFEVVTIPNKPVGLKCSNATSNSFTINWSCGDPSQSEGYEVVLNNGNPQPTTATTYTFSGLNPFTIYSVKVRAVDTYNDYSSYASINVATAPDATTVISGPSAVCNTSCTYSILNIPQGSTITWSVGRNITFINGNSGSSVTVKSTSPLAQGTSSINATIMLNGQSFNLLKGLWVGVPSPSISGPTSVHSGSTTIYSLNNPNQGVIDQTYWYANGGLTINGYNEDMFASVYATAAGTITCNAINQCGSGWGTLDVSVIGKLINPKLTLYPNPASSSITVRTATTESMKSSASLTNEKPIKSSTLAQAQIIRIYNSQGQIVKQVTANEGETSISVADLPEGFYIVHIINGDTVEKQPLQIKR